MRRLLLHLMRHAAADRRLVSGAKPSSVPIRIKFTWQTMGAIRGLAYPATYMMRPNDPPGSPSYPIALLVAQSGSYNTNNAYLKWYDTHTLDAHYLC